MQLSEGTIVQILTQDNKHAGYGTVIRNTWKSDFKNDNWPFADYRYPHRFAVMTQNGLEHYHESRLVYVWELEQEEIKNDARK
tara:strand:+ start:2007 stop:2255 length:249 start_codon:yes stop_codon:yes gene_type:complete